MSVAKLVRRKPRYVSRGKWQYTGCGECI